MATKSAQLSAHLPLAPFDQILSDYRAGKMVIIVDDADRENEGDLAVAAEYATAENLAFMMREARGLICVSLSRELADKLQLPPQVENNNSAYSTPFSVSIDHVSTKDNGVTASARAQTIRALLDTNAAPQHFVSPGHVFPLIANPAGVLGRDGQTEGSFDLARLAGLTPAAVICEILNPDGTMARGESLIEFAKVHDLKITSIEEIVRYRLSQEMLVRSVTDQVLMTDYGPFRTVVFNNDVDGKEHIALIHGDLASGKTPLVRIHSECLTGDVFGSRRCDCGPQLHEAIAKIKEHGVGIVLYLRQEGRGIGLGNKLRAYQLQDQGRDTVEANLELGFAADQRDFAIAAQMLNLLGVHKIKLLTNNPEKLRTMEQQKIVVEERLALITAVDDYCRDYIRVKREKLGHLL